MESHRFWLYAALAWLIGCPAASWAAPPVVVVTTSSIDAYSQAVAGLGLQTEPSRLRVIDLAGPAGAEPPGRALAATPPRLVVAIGSDALRALSDLPASIPVISTMVLQADEPRSAPAASGVRPVATVSLDVPIATVLAELKGLFPNKTRLGIIRNPNKSAPATAALQTKASQQGFTLVVADCAGAEQLLEAFLSLRGQVDFVWCLADSSLYTSVTAPPLILASLKHRLPLVGFSEHFVRAGAALGVYPNYQDIGRQTGELVRRFLHGRPIPAVESPRVFRVAVNQQVLRLLGLRCAQRPGSGNEFVVLP